MLEFAAELSATGQAQVGKELSDSTIQATFIPISSSQAELNLCSGQAVDYVDFWDNGFRIMLLLDRLVGFIKNIQQRERRYWRRFFMQADHEATLDRYQVPLIIAAKYGDKDALLEQTISSDVNEMSFSGKTALMYAALYGHIHIVEVLLSEHASINVSTPDWTPLELAVRGGSDEIVAMFLDAGAEINAQNYYGETALMWAAGSGATEIVDLLLRSGADTGSVDQHGAKASEWAAKVLHNVTRKDQYDSIIRLLS
jgi:hypothetical protein